MLLTPSQLAEIRQLIADHHSAFIANVIGAQAVAADVLARLKKKGLFVPKFKAIEDSYLYGQVLAALDNPKTASMSYPEFKRYIVKNPVPLGPIERQAVRLAEAQAGQYAVGLGNTVNQRTGQLMIEADHELRQKMRTEIRTATAAAIERRATVKQLKSDLGWATKDWARDWDRIAVTEKQSAFQHGVADHYAEKFGTEVLVAKRAMPDACRHCKRLHNDDDGNPKVFKLSTLIANGANFKVKAGEWKAVVGPVHPHCQCQLIRIPPGFGFNEEGKLVPGRKVQIADAEDYEASEHVHDELCKGDHAVGEVTFQGLRIGIESPVGSIRRWTDASGRKGATTMLYPYGYVMDTHGQDGDSVDVFVGPDPQAPNVFVVHQQDPTLGRYDEVKCFLGFADKAAAEAAYRAHYDKATFKLWTDEMDVPAFKRWVQSFQKAKPRERFVLSKGAEVIVGATQETRAMGPVSGTGANLMWGFARILPETDPDKLVPGDIFKLYEPEPEEANATGIYRDPEVYDYQSPLDVQPVRFDLPEHWRKEFVAMQHRADENRQNAERYAEQKRSVYRNTPDPAKSKPLEKSGYVKRPRTRVAIGARS